jgi:hypothetical protein
MYARESDAFPTRGVKHARRRTNAPPGIVTCAHGAHGVMCASGHLKEEATHQVTSSSSLGVLL